MIYISILLNYFVVPVRNPHSMYFVAVVCPGELDKKVRYFKEWMRDHHGSKVALRSPAHITLVPPFWSDLENENALLQDFMLFHSDLNPFEICLDGFSHFSNRVIFISILENESLQVLQLESVIHFHKYLTGIKAEDDRPFTPHVTIATRDLKPGDFKKAWEHFSKLKLREDFLASQVSLLKLESDGWKIVKNKPWK
jgi:2'-5' RNA ligase